MAIILQVDGTTYEFPVSGENPNWAEGVTGWAEGVTDVLNSLLALGDILETPFTISNNVATPSDINGLLFDAGVVRSAVIEYSVYRRTDSVLSGNAESGIITLVYDDDAAPNNKWKMTQEQNGTSGVVLNILDSGQMQYISSNLSGANYSGLIKFRAKTLSRT